MTKAGFTKQQAEAMAEEVTWRDDSPATKAGLAGTEAERKAENIRAEAERKAERAEVDRKIAEMKTENTKWIGGIIIFGAALLQTALLIWLFLRVIP